MDVLHWIIVIALIFLSINEIYKKTNHYYNTCVFEKKYFETRDYNDITDIVTGTSNALAATATFQKEGNYLILARRCQGIGTDLYLLNRCIDKVKKKTNVLLFFSPCVLLFEEEEKKNLERNCNSFSVDLVHQSLLTRLKICFPLLFDLRKVRYILFDEKRRKVFYPEKTETISATQAESKAKVLSNSWKNQFNIKDFTIEEIQRNRQDVINENKRLLIKMIELCKDNEWNPIIVSTPFSKKLLDILGDEFLSFFNKMIYDICQEQNVLYLNHLEDRDFVQSYSLFSDGCFVLNEQGSRIFMRKIIKQIRSHDNESAKKTV